MWKIQTPTSSQSSLHLKCRLFWFWLWPAPLSTFSTICDISCLDGSPKLKSGNFQLARWSHGVALFPVKDPPTRRLSFGRLVYQHILIRYTPHFACRHVGQSLISSVALTAQLVRKLYQYLFWWWIKGKIRVLVYVKFVKTRRKKILKMKITFYLFVLNTLMKRKPGSKKW